MAKDSIFTWVLLGGAAYLAYNYFTTPAVAAAPAGGGTTGGGTTGGTNTGGTNPPSGPTVPPATLSACGGTGQPACTPATTFSLLLNMAAGGSPTNIVMLDVDQWAYYYDQLNGVTGLSGTQVNAILAAAGITAANRSTTTMNAAQFTALLVGAGVTPPGMSGLGGYQGYVRAIPVPAMYARGFGRLTLGDLRNAGRF